jgi:hypothetical protein
MAPRKVNKTDPRNVAKPVSQLRGAAKQARISRVTKVEAGPATIKGGQAPGAGRSANVRYSRPSAPKTPAKPSPAPVRAMPEGKGQGPLPNPNLRSRLSDRPSKPVGTGKGGVTKPSGTAKMVNANKPTMQKLVRKAAQARKANAGRPLVKPAEAKRLMSQRAPGIRQGAAQLRQAAAGTTSPGAQARAQAQGKAVRRAAETRRVARATSQRMENRLKASQALRTIKEGAGLASRGGAFAAGIQAYNTTDGTLSAALRRGDYKPKQGPKPSTTQSSFNRKTFDQAFKAARTSGAKVFTWRGKKYTTKMKGE